MVRPNPDKNRTHILLTGGSGFLGRFILEEMLGASSPVPVSQVTVLDLKPLEGFADPRIRFIEGDVRDKNLVLDCCSGVDLVIHSAAVVDWGTLSKQEVLSVNVEGTRNMIDGCLSAGVKALVYTSSLDVLHDGKPLLNVDETHPYPERHSTSYCLSKCLAEKLVIEANSDQLRTVSLRPADIYGEGDPYHVGSLVRMAMGGFYVHLGNGQSRSQHAYAGNVAQAHLLAAGAMLNGSRDVAGKCYFITDSEGSNFFTFFDRIVEGAGYRIRPKNLWIPGWIGTGLGGISEFIALLWRPIRKYSPKMSRFAVTYICTDYTFTSEKARKDFGFIPKYSEKEAFERTVRHFRNNPVRKQTLQRDGNAGRDLDMVKDSNTNSD
jgi:nucleoside-diphosphate-sugar epimerase